MEKCERCKEPFPVMPVRGDLLEGGIPASFFNHYCAKCKGAIQAESNRAIADDMRERARRAEAETQRVLIEARRAAVGDGKAFEDWTFEKYQPDVHPQARRWFTFVKNFPLAAKNLFVYGPTGTSKSHGGVAKIKTEWEKNPPGFVRRFMAKDIRNLVRYNRYGQPNNEYERQQSLRELATRPSALFIDELDKVVEIKDVRAYEETVGLIRELITFREEAKKYGLILAANIDQENIAAIFGMPVVGRFQERSWEIFEFPPDTPNFRALIREA